MSRGSKKVFTLIATGLACLIVLIGGIAGCEVVEDSEVVVYQSYDGDVEVWSTPGLRLALYGKTTSYPKSEEFYFGPTTEEVENATEADKAVLEKKNCIRTRFNDGGAAHICGQLTFDLPLDYESMKALHSKFRSMEGVKSRLIRPAMISAVYNSGPLMSSREAAGARRSELSEFVDEQAKIGLYKTTRTKREIEDFTSPPVKTVEMVKVPVKNEDGSIKLDDSGKPLMEEIAQESLSLRKKTVMILEPSTDSNGKLVFQKKSAPTEYGVKLTITIGRIIFEPKVQGQINAQRDFEMKTQTKISESEMAKQEAITSEATGKAAAAKAKWDQEVKKAQALTEAQQKREVAKEDLETAKLQKAAMLERAKGEAEAKQLVMQADGAMDKKLKAWVEVQKAYAEQLGKQRWVPDVVMGSSNQNAAHDLMQLWQVKAAKDLNLDLQIKKK